MRAFFQDAGNDRWIFLGIGLIALVARLYGLDLKPMHHDEAQYGYYAWRLAEHGTYNYIPFMHGPFLYFVGALFFWIGQGTEFIARLPPALFGVATILVPYLLRKQLGRPAAIFVALTLALSPTFLYHSRYLRQDTYANLLHLVWFFGLVQFGATKQPRFLYIVAACIGFSYINHELAFISGFIMCVYFVGLYFVRTKKQARWHHWIDLLKTYRKPALISFGIFSLIYVLFFSTFFGNPKGLLHGLPNPFDKATALGYWLGQHEVNRGGQKPYYYFVLMVAYEFLPLFLALFACAVKEIRGHRLFQPCLFWWIASFLIYSWAGERMPWLLIHILTPMTLVAGFGVQYLWEKRKTAGLSFCALLLVWTWIASGRLSYVYEDDPRELHVFTQSHKDTQYVTDKIKQLEVQHGKKNITVYVEDLLSWPFSWYLRGTSISAFGRLQGTSITTNDNVKNSAVVLKHVYPITQRPLQELPDYVLVGTYALRWWWVAEQKNYHPFNPANFGRIFDWLIWRKTYEPHGYYYFQVWLKKPYDSQSGEWVKSESF